MYETDTEEIELDEDVELLYNRMLELLKNPPTKEDLEEFSNYIVSNQPKHIPAKKNLKAIRIAKRERAMLKKAEKHTHIPPSDNNRGICRFFYLNPGVFNTKKVRDVMGAYHQWLEDRKTPSVSKLLKGRFKMEKEETYRFTEEEVLELFSKKIGKKVKNIKANRSGEYLCEVE